MFTCFEQRGKQHKHRKEKNCKRISLPSHIERLTPVRGGRSLCKGLRFSIPPPSADNPHTSHPQSPSQLGLPCGILKEKCGIRFSRFYSPLQNLCLNCLFVESNNEITKINMIKTNRSTVRRGFFDNCTIP